MIADALGGKIDLILWRVFPPDCHIQGVNGKLCIYFCRTGMADYLPCA
jgi:phage host-nuclease inhibitor protein Gam